MAKTVEISNDAEVSWEVLPGGTGEFLNEGESIDDTIFGHTFRSGITGLIGWSINANALFKGFAGYLAEIKEIGATTGMTTEAMTLVTGKTFKIDDGTKEIWDRTVALVVWDNGAPVADADILNVDYLFGKVTFTSSYSVTAPVTINSGSYFPTAQLGKGQSFTLTQQADAIDNTDFETAQGNGGYRTFIPGLRTVALELGGIFDSTVNSKADLANRVEVIIEIDPVGDGLSIARGFFRAMSTSQAGDVGALEEETLNFTLNVPDETVNPAIEYPFAWEHDSLTTLSDAVRYLLESFDGQTEIDARYLPSGVIGETPLDGIKGAVIVTDVSLTGGLSDMNTFVANLQGTGAYTEV